MCERWSEQRANEWYAKFGWLRGCNFIPSSCANRLEQSFTTTTSEILRCIR